MSQELNFTLPTSTNVLTATGTQNFEEVSKNVENKHLPFLKYELLTSPEEVMLIDEEDDVSKITLSDGTSLFPRSPLRQRLQSKPSANDTNPASNVHSFVENESLTSLSPLTKDTSNKENINSATRESVGAKSQQEDFQERRCIVREGREVRQFALNGNDFSPKEVLRDIMNKRKLSNHSDVTLPRLNIPSGGFERPIAIPSNSLRFPKTSHIEKFINYPASEEILENERVMAVDDVHQTSTSLSSTSTTKHLAIPHSKEVGKKAINSFTSCPVSGRFRRVAEIVDGRKRSNPEERNPPSKRNKSKLIVPPFDKFAKNKKVQQPNGKETPIQQAIIRSADDIHTTTEYLTTLMKLKMKVLKKQLMEKEEKSPNYVPLVEGDALFNLFRHQWLQLNEQHQNDLFCKALDVMESFECVQ